MTNARFDELFDGPAREPETRDHAARDGPGPLDPGGHRGDRAARWPATRPSITGQRDACLAGGVALNCVANGRLLREGPFERIWIQPAAGDAGGAVGAALHGWHQITGHPRVAGGRDRRHGRRLPRPRLLRRRDRGATWTPTATRTTTIDDAAGAGRADRRAGRRRQGRRAVRGPDGVRAARARPPLDHRRPPLADDAVGHEPQDQVPRVLPALRPGGAGRAGGGVLRPRRRVALHDARRAGPRATLRASNGHRRASDLREWVNEVRSSIPAVTHVDYSARLQTVDREQSPEFHAILSAFEAADRLPGADQHLVQRARRADRVHARGRLPLLHAHRDGRTSCWAATCWTSEPSRSGPRTRSWREDYVLD